MADSNGKILRHHQREVHLALALEVDMGDKIVRAVGWMTLVVVQVAHDPAVVVGTRNLPVAVPVHTVPTEGADVVVGTRFAVPEEVLAQEVLAAEDSLVVVVVMEDDQDLVALKGQVVVGTIVRYQRASRNDQWPAPVVPNFVDDRLQALYPEVLNRDPELRQLVGSVAVAAARQPEAP
jgi:hypothetical protein